MAAPSELLNWHIVGHDQSGNLREGIWTIEQDDITSSTVRCLVAKWLKRWTADHEVPFSDPTGNRDFFSLGYTQPWPRVYSAWPIHWGIHWGERVFTFVSFGGDIKSLVPGNLN